LPVFEKAAFEEVFAIDDTPFVRGSNGDEVSAGFVLCDSGSPELKPGAALREDICDLSLVVCRSYEDIDGDGAILRCRNFSSSKEYVVNRYSALAGTDGGE